MKSDATTLTVMNPQGEIDTSLVSGVSPRVEDLEGKTIGLYWNGKPDGDLFWDIIEGRLKEKFPKIKVLRYNGPGDLGDKMAPNIAKEVDALMYGVGD
ncbi:MAG: hypothetical protein JW932_09690 [Deltaproteobacteria bacterium]|nr:hypothetical protein [Deltaproteobacteria bacterium]